MREDEWDFNRYKSQMHRRTAPLGKTLGLPRRGCRNPQPQLRGVRPSGWKNKEMQKTRHVELEVIELKC